MIRICKNQFFHFHPHALLGAVLTSLLMTACAVPGKSADSAAQTLDFTNAPDSARWHAQLGEWKSTPILLLGEQHDAPEHHALEADTVRTLAARQQLAALVMEMAEAGATTRGLPVSASEADVQAALKWNDKGWPWQSYGPSVMAAVQAGVPVLGGNLPRSQMSAIMKETRFDDKLDHNALKIQTDAIRSGHCDLLPESQLQPMARIQLARDESMAQTIASAVEKDRTVLLIAGHGHVRRDVGVPRWLPDNLQVRTAIAQTGKVKPAIQNEADIFIVTKELPPKDHCAELRKQFKK